MLKKKNLKGMISCLILLMLFSPAMAHASSKNLTVKYDKVRDVTTVDTKIEWLKKGFMGSRKTGFECAYYYPGATPARPSFIAMVFVAQRLMRDDYSWSGIQNISFLYGGTRITYDAAYESHIAKNILGVPSAKVEYLRCNIAVNDFLAMSQEKQISFEIGDKSDTIEKENLERIVELASSILPADKSTDVKHGYLGALVSNVKDHGASFGLDPNIKGALVESVRPNTPGEKSGLQRGDVITEFNGKTVSKATDLQIEISNTPIGSEIGMTILRNDKPMTLSVILAEYPDDRDSKLEESTSTIKVAPIIINGLGLSVSPLTPELEQRFGINLKDGVLIVAVNPNGTADNAGIKEGDVIERVGQIAVNTPQEVSDAVKGVLAKAPDDKKSVVMLVNTHGSSRYVILDLSPQ